MTQFLLASRNTRIRAAIGSTDEPAKSVECIARDVLADEDLR